MDSFLCKKCDNALDQVVVDVDLKYICTVCGAETVMEFASVDAERQAEYALFVGTSEKITKLFNPDAELYTPVPDYSEPCPDCGNTTYVYISESVAVCRNCNRRVV